MCSCEYPCTDECGSDVKVGLVVKLIGGKVWITNSITRANEMWARSSRSALSRRTLHYPKVIWTRVGINVGSIFEVGTISAYPSLSEGDLDKSWNQCGLDRRSWHYLGVPFTIRRWFGQQLEKCGHDRRSWHYLGLPFIVKKRIWTNLCKVNGLRSGIGPMLEQCGPYRNWIGPKIEQSRHYRQWIWNKI